MGKGATADAADRRKGQRAVPIDNLRPSGSTGHLQVFTMWFPNQMQRQQRKPALKLAKFVGWTSAAQSTADTVHHEPPIGG